MKTISELCLRQLVKMSQDKSWLVGSATSALAITVPTWIFTNDSWTINHSVLIFGLIGVLIGDQVVGRRLASKSTVSVKDSSVMIDSLVRDLIMLGICGLAYGLDFLFETGSVLFVFTVASFFYHNFYSLLANVVVLGWGDKFPLWLFIWLNDEIKLKTQKYFPNSSVNNPHIQQLKEHEVDRKDDKNE